MKFKSLVFISNHKKEASEFRVFSKGYPRSQYSVTTLYTVYICMNEIKPPWDGKENWNFVIADTQEISLKWPGSHCSWEFSALSGV